MKVPASHWQTSRTPMSKQSLTTWNHRITLLRLTASAQIPQRLSLIVNDIDASHRSHFVTPDGPPSTTRSTSSFSSSMLSWSLFFCEVYHDEGHWTPNSLIQAKDSHSQLSITHSWNMHKLTKELIPHNSSRGQYNRFDRFRGRRRETEFPSDKNKKGVSYSKTFFS